ncbi:hypothetical protein F4803DRAFT_301435 [Xylaria telfairii]|nr:hypothetical protein F4803DRAFT_301435 [Xylaria telfairii]
MATPITPIDAVIAAGFAGFPINSNDEITQIWKQVEDRVLQMAGGDSTRIQQGLSIEQVLYYLDNAQADDKKAAEKHGSLKKVMSHTLSVIETVGGIVADGASMVFQPANVCYNALTFVIRAWRGYQGMFESLTGLLEQCVEFLDRLTYYAKSGMDAKLTKVACRHLQLFVEICDRALRLSQKRSKIMAFTKQLFLIDDGVKDLLAQMKNLVGEEHRLVSAHTFKSSNEAAANSRDNLTLAKKADAKLDAIMNDKNEQRRAEETRRWRKAVINTLDFEQSERNSTTQEPKEPKDRWRDVWRKHREVAEGTGDWLSKHQSFMSWVRGTSSSILGIEGGDGTGKTILAANTIMLLQKPNAIGILNSRSVVAYYFLEADSKATVDKKEIGYSVSNSLLWQLAKEDTPFLKSVALVCEKAKRFRNHQDVWTQLLLENNDRINQDSVFFVVIDGLGDDIAVLTELLQKLSADPTRHKTRVLLTGKPSTFQILGSMEGVKFDKIELGCSNAPDVELYIRARLDKMGILKDHDQPDVPEMQEKIFNTLRATTGDYFKLGSVLDNIAKSNGDVGEINEYLDMAGQTGCEQLMKEIEQLNKTRSQKEIDEINEIIRWVNSSRDWQGPKQMEAVLALRTSNNSSQQTSLLSLRSKISTKYSLFSLIDGVVDYKLPEWKESIPRKRGKKNADGISNSGSKEIHPAEINLLKHYLSTICPNDVYDKFGFDEFFNHKLTLKGSYICQDPDNSEITLALRCLTCLVERRTDITKRMHSYAHQHLYYHLKLTDLSLADRELKAEVGEKLVKLFTTRYGIDSLLYLDPINGVREEESIYFRQTIPENWKPWLFSEDGVDLLSTWFKDSAVLERVKETQFVVAYKSADANRRDLLFTLGLEQAATRLFREESSKRQLLDAFMLLASYLQKRTVEDSDHEEKDNFLNGLWNPTIETVDLVEDWSGEKLGIDKDAVWEAHAANLLFYLSGAHITNEDAEARARKALKLDPGNWRASYTLARVIKSQDEAIAILNRLIEERASDAEWHDKESGKIMAEMLIDLGDKYWALEDKTQLAIEAYFRSLDKCRSLFKQYFRILQAIAERGEQNSVISFLEKLLNDPNESAKNAVDFVTKGANDTGDLVWAIFRMFACAAQTTNRWDVLHTYYTEVTATKSRDGSSFYFRRQYGIFLAEIKGDEEASYAVLKALLEDGTKFDDEGWRRYAIEILPGDIVPIYTKLAFRKDKKGETAETIHTKVEMLCRDFEAVKQTYTHSVLAFARYFHLHGDEVRARKLARDIVMQALELLSDDDIENDYSSFWDLGRVFSTLRDEVNVFATWDLMARARKAEMKVYAAKRKALEEQTTKANEKQLEETQDTNTPEEPSDLPKPEMPTGEIAYCDSCGHEWTYPSEIWICADDLGRVQFDENCYRKLKEGTLETKICDKDHFFYHIGKRDEAGLNKVEDGLVYVADRVITLEEWKSEVKAKYVDFGVSV